MFGVRHHVASLLLSRGERCGQHGQCVQRWHRCVNGFVNSVIDLEAKRDTTRGCVCVDTSVTARDVVQCVSNRHPDDDGTDQTSLSVPQSTPCKLICVATLETPPPHRKTSAFAVRTHAIISPSSGRHLVRGNQVHRPGTGDTGDAA